MPQRIRLALSSVNGQPTMHSGGYFFVLHGQPIQPVESSITHPEPPQWYELLLRLHDPTDMGLKMPVDFLPRELEDGKDPSGYLESIDFWVLVQTAELIKKHPGLRFSVNFSRHLLNSPLLFKRIAEIFKGVDTHDRLTMEVSERYLWTEYEIEQMRHLNTIVRLELDDLGEARLSQLVKLPISGFKIDKSLVANIAKHPHAEALVRSLVAFASASELTCVCEHVSDAYIWRRLKIMKEKMPNADLWVQGHAVGPFNESGGCYRLDWD